MPRSHFRPVKPKFHFSSILTYAFVITINVPLDDIQVLCWQLFATGLSACRRGVQKPSAVKVCQTIDGQCLIRTCSPVNLTCCVYTDKKASFVVDSVTQYCNSGNSLPVYLFLPAAGKVKHVV